MAPAALFRSEIIGDSSPFKLTNVARSSPKQLSDNPVRVISDAVAGHQVRPFDPHSVERTTSVSQQESSGTISERAKRALERRLRPHTTLSAYELGQTLRISESTIWSLLSGNSKSGPSGRVLHKLVEFFGAAFLHEVFGGPNIVVIDPRSTQKAARIAELHEELRRLG